MTLRDVLKITADSCRVSVQYSNGYVAIDDDANCILEDKVTGVFILDKEVCLIETCIEEDELGYESLLFVTLKVRSEEV